MTDFSAFTALVLTKVEDLARSELRDALTAARNDAESFLQRSKADFERWSEQLKDGRLTAEEFEDLVIGQASVFEMRALTLTGIAKVKADKFREGVLNIVVESAFAVFL